MAARSRLRVVDAISEAWIEAIRRPARLLTAGLGVMLSLAGIVAATALVATVQFQVSDEFDLRVATQVELRPAPTVSDTADQYNHADAMFASGDGVSRALHGASGITGVAVIRESTDDLRAQLVRSPDGRSASTSVTVRAVTADGLQALGVRVDGPGWSRWHEQNGARLVLVGDRTADELGLHAGDVGDVLHIDGIPYVLAGVVNDAGRLPAARDGLLVPLTATVPFQMDNASDRIIVTVNTGAATEVAAALPLLIDPVSPDAWVSYSGGSDEGLRRDVDGQIERFAYVLGSVVLLLGIASIGNATLSTVLQRTGEIGLRPG